VSIFSPGANVDEGVAGQCDEATSPFDGALSVVGSGHETSIPLLLLAKKMKERKGVRACGEIKREKEGGGDENLEEKICPQPLFKPDPDALV
jgi:hypothetical protein